MAYTKHNFKSGDKLMASQLNEIEEQVVKNENDAIVLSEEITDLKEDLNDLKNQIGQGGGGTGITPEDADLLKEVLYMNEYSTAERALEAKGKIDTFIIHLKAVKVVSISASYTGGSVREGTSVSDLVGLVVRATYSDETEEVVDTYTLSPSTISVGSNTITVTYNGKTTTFMVTGITNTVTSLSAVYSGENVVEGTSTEDLRTDIVVTATYDDGTSAVVYGWSISGTVVVGTNDFVISYGGKTTSITVIGTQKPRTDIKGDVIYNDILNKSKDYNFYKLFGNRADYSTYIINVKANTEYRMVWELGANGQYANPQVAGNGISTPSSSIENNILAPWIVCIDSDMKDATTDSKTAHFENALETGYVYKQVKGSDGIYRTECYIKWGVDGWFSISTREDSDVKFYFYEV